MRHEMYWLDENFSMNLKEHLLCAFQEIQSFTHVNWLTNGVQFSCLGKHMFNSHFLFHFWYRMDYTLRKKVQEERNTIV